MAVKACVSCKRPVASRAEVRAGLAPEGTLVSDARGMCVTCYDAWRKAGKPPVEEFTHEPHVFRPRPCSSCRRVMVAPKTGEPRTDGPVIRHHSHGLCWACYAAWIRAGQPPVEGFRHVLERRQKRQRFRKVWVVPVADAQRPEAVEAWKRRAEARTREALAADGLGIVKGPNVFVYGRQIIVNGETLSDKGADGEA